MNIIFSVLFAYHAIPIASLALAILGVYVGYRIRLTLSPHYIPIFLVVFASSVCTLVLHSAMFFRGEEPLALCFATSISLSAFAGILFGRFCLWGEVGGLSKD
ncbi:MAG: hypothetical protein P4L53_03665 [Candidatus Obscuribacterales bacterium]|nr:hypothetical protein [Candidatus Obscuribacterales bacterium]